MANQRKPGSEPDPQQSVEGQDSTEDEAQKSLSDMVAKATEEGVAEDFGQEMTDDPRASRDAESREFDARESDAFVPEPLLPTPNAQDGYVFRWIRTTMRGSVDNTNVSKRFREGWRPVAREDHPELQFMTDFESRFPENIEIGGLLLCKAPEAQMAKRKAYYDRVAQQQIQSVDQNMMRESDPRMPMNEPERSTNVTFGRR